MERKFTDDEIVKALDICSKNNVTRHNGLTYAGIPLRFLFEEALDLINRQKAEIERLKEAYAIYEETTGLKWARAEAIKEFAERLKERKCHYTETEHTFDFDGVDVDEIDNLVKEMTGENNNE